MAWPVSIFQDLAVPSEEPVNSSLSGSLAAMHRRAEPWPLNTTTLLSLCSVHALAVLSADPNNNYIINDTTSLVSIYQ